MTDRTPVYLLIVRNGPVWDLEKTLGFFARTLGVAFEGEICTYGSEPGFLPGGEGGLEVRRYAWRNPRNLLARLFYTLRVVGRGLRARWVSRRKLVVIAYDPFQSGIIGLLVKWTTGAIFICEVNGVYGEDANLIDIEDDGRRQRKKMKMLRLGSFILRRADFIKLLFPEQLLGFDLAGVDKPKAWFPNLIDTGMFRPMGLRPQKRLAFVGYPFRRKGVDLLLRAFARTRAEFPDWRLAVIGFGHEPLALAEELPVDGVEFIAPQPTERLARELEGCAALVLPSRSEAMGRVLLESALLKRARLGSRVGGIPSYIDDGVDGLLFEPDNVDSLESVLRRFMADPELRDRLGTAARERAEREFTGEEYVRRYSEVLDHVVAGSWDGP